MGYIGIIYSPKPKSLRLSQVEVYPVWPKLRLQCVGF